jgi:hypothetical protein
MATKRKPDKQHEQQSDATVLRPMANSTMQTRTPTQATTGDSKKKRADRIRTQ